VLELRWPAPLHARVVRGASIPSRAGFRTASRKRVPGDTLVVSGTVAAHWQGVSSIRISRQTLTGLTECDRTQSLAPTTVDGVAADAHKPMNSPGYPRHATQSC
jgi:hypothetical protein